MCHLAHLGGERLLCQRRRPVSPSHLQEPGKLAAFRDVVLHEQVGEFQRKGRLELRVREGSLPFDVGHGCW